MFKLKITKIETGEEIIVASSDYIKLSFMDDEKIKKKLATTGLGLAQQVVNVDYVEPLSKENTFSPAFLGWLLQINEPAK